jgi:hypothetical protein
MILSEKTVSCEKIENYAILTFFKFFMRFLCFQIELYVTPKHVIHDDFCRDVECLMMTDTGREGRGFEKQLHSGFRNGKEEVEIPLGLKNITLD